MSPRDSKPGYECRTAVNQSVEGSRENEKRSDGDLRTRSRTMMDGEVKGRAPGISTH